MKIFFLFAVLFSGLAACKSKSGSAFKYNKAIVQKDVLLQLDEQTTEDKVTLYYKEGKYDSVGIAGEHMESLLQKAIEDIDTMPVPRANGIEEFKDAVVKYFKFFKSIYTVYKEYGLAGTDEKREELINEKGKLIVQRDDVVKDLQQAQKIFSEANGFRMQ
jgi:hypothetical protein